MNPHNTYVHLSSNSLCHFFDAKRLIGCKFEDAEVQLDLKHFPFKVFSKNGKPQIRFEYRGEGKKIVRGRFFYLSLHILTTLKDRQQRMLEPSRHERSTNHQRADGCCDRLRS
jgi:molecular chaperone DnaK (HSP70)